MDYEDKRLLTRHGFFCESKMREKSKEAFLYKAAKNGKLKLVKKLLAEGANVNKNSNESPLHIAAEKGFDEIVQVLVDNGAEVNRLDPHGRSPLIRAALHGHSNVVDLLIAAGAEVDKEELLYNATQKGKLKLVKKFVAEGANVNGKYGERGHNQTALHCAFISGYDEIVQFLIDNGAEVNSEHEDGKTPLHEAAHHNESEVMKKLIAAGAEVGKADQDGRTPLHVASQGVSTASALKILVKNAKSKENHLEFVDAKDKWGQTALVLATRSEKTENAKILLNNGSTFGSEMHNFAALGRTTELKAFLESSKRHLSLSSS